MSSDQVKAVLEDLGNIWPQIIEHNLAEDWSRPAIRKALSLFPAEHPDGAVIAAHRVQHHTGVALWTDYNPFKDTIVEYLATEEESRRASAPVHWSEY